MLISLNAYAVLDNDFISSTFPVMNSSYEFKRTGDNPWYTNSWADTSKQSPYSQDAQQRPRPQQDKYISAEELEALGNMHAPSAIWSDGNRYGDSGTDAGGQGVWGSLETRDLVRPTSTFNATAGSYAPYAQQQYTYQAGPSWNTYVPGVNQTYQSNRYYQQYAPSLNTGKADGLRSGTYLNNSIAPFLYQVWQGFYLETVQFLDSEMVLDRSLDTILTINRGMIRGNLE